MQIDKDIQRRAAPMARAACRWRAVVCVCVGGGGAYYAVGSLRAIKQSLFCVLNLSFTRTESQIYINEQTNKLFFQAQITIVSYKQISTNEFIKHNISMVA